MSCSRYLPGTRTPCIPVQSSVASVDAGPPLGRGESPLSRSDAMQGDSSVAWCSLRKAVLTTLLCVTGASFYVSQPIEGVTKYIV